MIVDILRSVGPWSWVILGVVLILAEMLLPGVFLVWLGLAGVVTGVVDLALDLSWQVASLIFGILAIAFVIVGRFLSQRGQPSEDGAGVLNHRAQRLIGRVYVLDTPITRGEGRVRIGDSSWRVIGPDAPAGASVKIVRTEGATLFVEQV